MKIGFEIVNDPPFYILPHTSHMDDNVVMFSKKIFLNVIHRTNIVVLE